jgi:hypothetical protein
VKKGLIRLGGGALAAPAGSGPAPLDVSVMGDEFRIVAELADDAPRPDYYSGFEFIATDGADWGVSDLQRHPACPPAGLNIEHSGDGIVITWLGDNYRLQGAVDVTGPWFDLGVNSPVVLPATTTARFFRLNCD